MKQFFASALLLTCLGLPASATSIEVIDNMVTGPKGKSSIVTLGGSAPCLDTACIDTTGGDPKLNTASAQAQIASATNPLKKINFSFARLFPDPAVPVPSAPVEEAAGSAPSLEIPLAPADSGTVAAQPPVMPQPDPSQSGAPQAAAPADLTRGSIDPNAPVMPIVNSELRDGE